MAVGHVADSNLASDFSATNTLSVTLTVASGHSNNALVALVLFTGAHITSVSSMVWDAAGANQAFTLAGTGIIDIAGSLHLGLQAFRLVNPTPGTSKLVTVTLSGAVSAVTLVAAHFDGVDQTTPIRASSYRNDGDSGGSSPCSLQITTAVGDITITGLVSDQFTGSAPTTNRTLIGSMVDAVHVGYSYGMDFGTPDATPFQHDWTLSNPFSITKSLGFSLAAASATFPTTPIRDNFNRANENPLAGNWVTATAFWVNPLKLVSNQVVPSINGTYQGSYYNQTFGPDFEAFVDIVTAPGTDNTYVAMEFSVQAENAESAPDGFNLTVIRESGSYDVQLFRIDDGSYTQLGATTAVGGTPQAMGLSRSGSTLTA